MKVILVAVIDLVKIASLALVVFAAILSWIRITKPEYVQLSRLSVTRIVIRTLVVHMVVFGVFWLWLGCSVNSILIVLAVGAAVVFLCLPFSQAGGVGADFLFGPILLGVMTPYVFVFQFILGFPAMNELFIPDEPENSSKPEREDHRSKVGVVIATLKPSGQVELDGASYDAVSEGGVFIEIGRVVSVCETRNAVLVVRESTTD